MQSRYGLMRHPIVMIDDYTVLRFGLLWVCLHFMLAAGA